MVESSERRSAMPFAVTLALFFICGSDLAPSSGIGPSRVRAALAVDDDIVDVAALAPGSERSPFPELELDGVHAPAEYDDEALPDDHVIAKFFDPSAPEDDPRNDFFFGLATAPAHVEDDLQDAWLGFAQNGGVKAWHNTPNAAERVQFWSRPETEIRLAAEAGATVFRMGLDWARLVPSAEASASGVNPVAMARYRQIIEMVNKAGMRPMITLFHHSAPAWLAGQGGWTNSSAAIPAFEAFTEGVIDALIPCGASTAEHAGPSAQLHSIIPFNEPHVFNLLTYCGGVWPSTAENMNRPPSPPTCLSEWGLYGVAMKTMAEAHRAVYDKVRNTEAKCGMEAGSIPVGVAHHVPIYSAYSFLDEPARKILEWHTTFWFHDLIADKVDICGVNYYGQEWISGASVAVTEREEYSDAGRSLYPDGMFLVLQAFDRRYPNTKFMITENGVADGADLIRPSYMIEHLLALHAAIQSGVDIVGYVFWTISDNWEWADGYCPKFGLVGVDRNSNGTPSTSTPVLERSPRESYHLFHAIATSGTITAGQRRGAWASLQGHVQNGTTRPFCRAEDGVASLDEAVQRPLSSRDWRFGHYVAPDAQAKKAALKMELNLLMTNAHQAAAAAFADIEASNPRVAEVVAAATAAADEAEHVARRAQKALATHLAEAQDAAKKESAALKASLAEKAAEAREHAEKLLHSGPAENLRGQVEKLSTEARRAFEKVFPHGHQEEIVRAATKVAEEAAEKVRRLLQNASTHKQGVVDKASKASEDAAAKVRSLLREAETRKSRIAAKRAEEAANLVRAVLVRGDDGAGQPRPGGSGGQVAGVGEL